MVSIKAQDGGPGSCAAMEITAAVAQAQAGMKSFPYIDTCRQVKDGKDTSLCEGKDTRSITSCSTDHEDYLSDNSARLYLAPTSLLSSRDSLDLSNHNGFDVSISAIADPNRKVFDCNSTKRRNDQQDVVALPHEKLTNSPDTSMEQMTKRARSVHSLKRRDSHLNLANLEEETSCACVDIGKTNNNYYLRNERDEYLIGVGVDIENTYRENYRGHDTSAAAGLSLKWSLRKTSTTSSAEEMNSIRDKGSREQSVMKAVSVLWINEPETNATRLTTTLNLREADSVDKDDILSALADVDLFF